MNEPRITLVRRKPIPFDSASTQVQRGIPIFPYSIPMTNRRRVTQSMVNLPTLGLRFRNSFRVANAEGEYRWFLTRVEPLRASDGTLQYWIGVNVDIDEGRRAEDKIGSR